MSSQTGRKIKVSIFGESHGSAIGAVIDNIPAGEYIDFEELLAFMKRRQGGNNPYSTPRKEDDVPELLSGIKDGYTTGAPISLIIRNNNIRSNDYKIDIPRPGHADFTAYVKYNGFCDFRGGGHFSGRLTAPLCAVGGILIQILKRRNIKITAHISSIAGITDKKLNAVDFLGNQIDKEFPVIDKAAGDKMKQAILEALKAEDSVGGSIECGIYGVSAGLGDPMFDGIENRISSVVFGIGAVKGIEFGLGFDACSIRGSQNNDEFYMDNDTIKTKTNNHGGILGGITSGMPVIFNVAIKPTPSIGKEQGSVSFSEKKDVSLKIVGRHDPCIVPRAVACIEAAAAIAISDFVL